MSEVLKRRMRCAVYTRKSTDEGLARIFHACSQRRAQRGIAARI